MASAKNEVEYAFEEGHQALQLRVKMPMTQSMEESEIHLEVGHMEVRLLVSDFWHCLALPQHLVQRVSGEAAAKFSRRRKELIIAWPLSPDVIWEEDRGRAPPKSKDSPSGSSHWDLELADEVRQHLLRSGAGEEEAGGEGGSWREEEDDSSGSPKVRGADWLRGDAPKAKEGLAKTKEEELRPTLPQPKEPEAPDSSPSPTSPTEEPNAQDASPSPKMEHGFAPAYGSNLAEHVSGRTSAIQEPDRHVGKRLALGGETGTMAVQNDSATFGGSNSDGRRCPNRTSVKTVTRLGRGGSLDPSYYADLPHESAFGARLGGTRNDTAGGATAQEGGLETLCIYHFRGQYQDFKGQHD
eukprot:s292_g7.t3